MSYAEGNGLGRRELLWLASASPLLAFSGLPAPATAAATRAVRPDAASAKATVYGRMLGLPRIVNAAGAVTAFGGTTLSKEVTDAMAEASRHYVDLNALYAAAGSKLAEITKAEAAMVTSGAFAAMTLAAAACLAGTDKDKIAALPQASWPRRETVIQRAHSTPYDRAYRNAGMTNVYVDTEEEMLAAIGERTAMIGGLTMVEKSNQPGIISLERLIAIGKRANVPVYLDASFALTHLSDMSSLSRYTGMGADLVGISGGKGVHGPQSTGILAGRADLVAAARLHASPNPAGLGRGLKVDKEEVIGLLTAVEQLRGRDSQALYRRDRRRVEAMRAHLADVPGLRLGYEEAFFGPGLVLMWDQAEIPLTHDQFLEQMRQGEQPIAVHVVVGRTVYFVGEYTGPGLFAGYLNDGEEELVAKRAREILLAARERKAGATSQA
ncbi:hypothetical protein [Sphingosinicella rhizophila]|uniref:L-seryl-tRNA(Ser) seleniumtransferase n=1 Tax=Sphingosinicella rhizophila TaxID=3050082 RepID=A0ABU3QAS9_9SPHN|nr:hypothetical protein [Sphingosinicella sp. GR2756]MDT9600513.1 hypothetical protein [Sphingosinicella sp. GR2756]